MHIQTNESIKTLVAHIVPYSYHGNNSLIAGRCHPFESLAEDGLLWPRFL